MQLSRRHVLGAGLALACLPRKAGAARASTARVLLRKWLAAFNAPRLSTYRDFARANLPADLLPYLDEDLGVVEASGGFQLLRSEDTAAGEITAWVRDRHWDRFSKVMLSTANGKIGDLSFGGAPTPVGFTVKRLGETQAIEAVRTKLAGEAAARRFSGAVLITKDGRALLREAYGARDASGLPALPGTRFCLGSMGKMFTAVAILQLVQAGTLRLTDTLAMLLPAYPNKAMAQAVTVEHLLTHTGGTGDFFGPDYESHAAELRGPADFIPLFGKREPLFPPGSQWSYSNFGFILLGAILEQVSGMRWDQSLDRTIFRPVGMSATSAIATEADTAVPLTGAAQTGLKPLPYYVGLPAGGGYSTIDDLGRFAVALKTGALLDARHLAMLTTPRVPAGTRHWSLGLSLTVRNGETCYGHGGSAPGVNADFAVYPHSGYLVAVLCNRGHPHAANVADYIGARLPAD